MKYQKGDLITRDVLRHPDGIMVVDRYDEQDDLWVRPLGGGIVRMIPDSEAGGFSKLSLPSAPLPYRKAKFWLEAIGDGEYEGWTTGLCWNGWARPVFLPDVAFEIASKLPQEVRYCTQRDAFMGQLLGEDLTWPGELVNLPEVGTRKVYPLGDCFWIWEECEHEMERSEKLITPDFG
jgi:hypothetical protein